MRLTSCSLSRHYRAWWGSLNDESRVIRRGALAELHEVLALERWLVSLRAELRPASAVARCEKRIATEIKDRCRVLHLVRRGISACTADRNGGALRGFLSQLGADEAGRVYAICEGGVRLQGANIDRA